MLIFGFGAGKPEDLGEVAPAVCPNCHNHVFLHRVRSKKSVRLYFVPVVPYGTNEYLLCPVCTQGLQLSAEQQTAVQSMTNATKSYRSRRLAEPQYLAQVDRFWAQIGVDPSGRRVLSSTPAAAVPAAASAPAVPQAAATPDGTAASWVTQLRDLAALHDQGVLSDDQYEAAKQRVLETNR